MYKSISRRKNDLFQICTGTKKAGKAVLKKQVLREAKDAQRPSVKAGSLLSATYTGRTK